ATRRRRGTAVGGSAVRAGRERRVDSLAGGGDRTGGFRAGQPEPGRSLLCTDGPRRRGRGPGRPGMTDIANGAPAPSLRQVAAPARPSAASNALVFGWRAVLKFKHLPEQLFDLVMTPIMFTLLFTFVFGGA